MWGNIHWVSQHMIYCKRKWWRMIFRRQEKGRKRRKMSVCTLIHSWRIKKYVLKQLSAQHSQWMYTFLIILSQFLTKNVMFERAISLCQTCCTAHDIAYIVHIGHSVWTKCKLGERHKHLLQNKKIYCIICLMPSHPNFRIRVLAWT